jgi:GxxExxY protein
MTHNEIAKTVMDIAFRIHRKTGPGLLESAYSTILEYELRKRGVPLQKEVPVPLQWEDLFIECAYRADIVIEDKVVIELKALEELHPVHFKQLTTYLKLLDKRLGLLVNFGQEKMKDGFKRVANTFEND